MMNKNTRFFSILIVPDGGGKTVHFKVRSYVFKIVAFTVLAFILGGVLGVVFTGRIAAKLQLVNHLAHQNEELKKANATVQQLAQELTKIKQTEQKIRTLAMTFLQKDQPTAENGLEIKTAYANDEVDDFVSKVRRKQKAMEITTAEGTVSRQIRMLAAVPTLRPVNGWITRGFSMDIKGSTRQYKHSGVDIAAATGTPIMAAAPGVVTFAGWQKLFGNFVIVNHGFGYETCYGHCSRILVKRGDLVERGETVALVGSSGRSTAPHLHYEIRKNGTPVDPMLYFVH